jgi:hypothetical protein
MEGNPQRIENEVRCRGRGFVRGQVPACEAYLAALIDIIEERVRRSEMM